MKNIDMAQAKSQKDTFIDEENLPSEVKKVLFVCLGNICRSPAAHGILKQKSKVFTVDSCGTGGWHAGELPDPRMIKAAMSRGYTLDHRARQLKASDLKTFDLILAMDRSVKKETMRMLLGEDREENVTRDGATVVNKIITFGTLLGDPQRDIPDPYYGGLEDFERVLDLLEKGIDELIVRWESKSEGSKIE